jgi:hypothetical protein
VTLRWFREAMGILVPWRRNAAVVPIQRWIRVVWASRVYGRLVGIQVGVGDMLAKKRASVLGRVLWRWGKCNYLYRREKIRASKRVVRALRRMMHRAMIRDCEGKKRRCITIIDIVILNKLTNNA